MIRMKQWTRNRYDDSIIDVVSDDAVAMIDYESADVDAIIDYESDDVDVIIDDESDADW